MRKFFIPAVAFVMAIGVASAQEDEMVYRRSSLHQIFIPCRSNVQEMLNSAAAMGYKITVPEKIDVNKDFTPDVLNTLAEYPFPDKYNNHEIELKSIELEEGILDSGIAEDDDKKKESGGNKEKVDKVQLSIEKTIADKQIAKELVKKWFNYNNGHFDMNLVGERGMYNASEMQAAIAKGEARGLTSLADAGEELIGNTFITFSYTRFVPQFIGGQIAKQTARAIVDVMPDGLAKTIAQAAAHAADLAYIKKEYAYKAVTVTYLYKLVWDEETSSKFYAEFWSDPKAFEADTTTFRMELVGMEKQRNSVSPKLKEVNNEGFDDVEVVKRTVIRNMDKMYADLAKNYDVFKPKTPVLSENPTTAQIGKKEGLEGGEKFDVMEMTFDKKEGKTYWKVVGQVTVDKKLIWDNRYAAGQDEEDVVDESIKATTFKGKASPGQFLRQKK